MPLRQLPAERGHYLRERAAQGPWVEAWVERPRQRHEQLFREMGVRALGCAGVRYGGDLVGLLTITSSDDDATSRLTDSLPALLEFAAGAGVLMGPAVVGLTAAVSVRRRMTGIIGDELFHPVFQPIIQLETRETVGYEALTRFDSGQRPDLCFADARAVDMGPDLELATIRAAMAESRKLPAGRWLSLNVSPQVLLQTEPPERLVVRRSERPIVLEITEHEIIDDYGALAVGHSSARSRSAPRGGRCRCRDRQLLPYRRATAQPGEARHRSGRRDVNRDLGRQALVVGMRHFARQAGCLLLAEGIETEPEARTLAKFAVELGQGYSVRPP